MPSTDFGQGVALQSNFNTADRLWASDYNRKANAIATEAKAKDAQRKAAYDYVSKYLDVHQSGLAKVYQDDTHKMAADYLTNLAVNLQKNPNYANTAEDIQARQKLFATIDERRGQSEMAKGYGTYMMSNPDKVKPNEEINNAMNGSDISKLREINKKYYGVEDERFPVEHAGIGIPDYKKYSDLALQNVYTGQPIDHQVHKSAYNTLHATDLINPNLDIWNTQAEAIYKAHPKELQGVTLEEFKKNLVQPPPLIKPSSAPQIQQHGKGLEINNGIETNKSGNILLKVTDPDNQGFRTLTGTGSGIPYEDNKVVYTIQKKNAKGKLEDITYSVHKPVLSWDNKGTLVIDGDFKAVDDEGKEIPVAKPKEVYFNKSHPDAKKLAEQFVALNNNTIDIDFGRKNPVMVVKKAAQTKEVQGNLKGLIIDPNEAGTVTQPKQKNTTKPTTGKRGVFNPTTGKIEYH